MSDSLPIEQVVRRTGVSARALRFYEARGLVAPLRTASGRRLFAPADLERIAQIMTLKRAGLTLGAIGALFAVRRPPIEPMLRAQLEIIEGQAAALTEAARLLRTALSRIEGGEPLDAATLCSLIQTGETMMTTKEQWDRVSARYLSEEAKTDFATWPDQALSPEEGQRYTERWADLGARIKAALPLDPASEQAQAFVREWSALLEPFRAVATPAMMEGITRMYDDMSNWGESAPSPGFDHEVWTFIQQASAARRG